MRYNAARDKLFGRPCGGRNTNVPPNQFEAAFARRLVRRMVKMNTTVESIPAARNVRAFVTLPFLAFATAFAFHAHAQESGSTPAAPIDERPSQLEEAVRPEAPYRYSSNAKTNERLNAVFTLIQREGNGRTWEKRPATETAEDPTRVAAKAASKGNKPTTASDPQRPVPAQSASPEPKVEPMPVLSWAFRPNASAQQTVSEWARAAGWKEPTWKATNAFQGQGEVRGTFIDALRALANAAPQLDIYASIDKREIVVSDAPR